MKPHLPLLLLVLVSSSATAQQRPRDLEREFPDFSVQDIVRFQLYLAGEEMAAAFTDGSVPEERIRERLRTAAAGMRLLLERGELPATYELVPGFPRAVTRMIESVERRAEEAYIGPLEPCGQDGRPGALSRCDAMREDHGTFFGTYYSLGSFEHALRAAGSARGPVRHGATGDIESCVGDDGTVGGVFTRISDGARAFRGSPRALGLNAVAAKMCWLAVPVGREAERYARFKERHGGGG